MFCYSPMGASVPILLCNVRPSVSEHSDMYQSYLPGNTDASDHNNARVYNACIQQMFICDKVKLLVPPVGDVPDATRTYAGGCCRAFR